MLLAEVDEELERARAACDRSRPAASSPVAAAPPSCPTATPSALKAERARLVQALHRIEDGSYGRCLDCGLSIPNVRLKRQPHALTCLPCPGAPASGKWPIAPLAEPPPQFDLPSTPHDPAPWLHLPSGRRTSN